jgi:hypothetical protein
MVNKLKKVLVYGFFEKSPLFLWSLVATKETKLFSFVLKNMKNFEAFFVSHFWLQKKSC